MPDSLNDVALTITIATPDTFWEHTEVVSGRDPNATEDAVNRIAEKSLRYLNGDPALVTEEERVHRAESL